jgi:hypothetical protein
MQGPGGMLKADSTGAILKDTERLESDQTNANMSSTALIVLPVTRDYKSQ